MLKKQNVKIRFKFTIVKMPVYTGIFCINNNMELLNQIYYVLVKFGCGLEGIIYENA